MVNGKRLNHFGFVDNIVLIGNNRTEIEEMLNHLNDESRKIGLKINIKKTKVMFNEYAIKPSIQIGTQIVDQVVNTST